jgi:Tol biopolymer transport system component
VKKLFFILVSLITINNNAFAVDPFLDWKTIESEHNYVHYAEGNKAIAERASVIADQAYEQLTKEFNWQPKEKTHVVLSDETDFPNGFATPIFLNHTVLFLAPPTSVNTLEDFDDWFGTLILHEYTHIIQLDKSSGSPEYLRKIFGRFVFLFPNLFQPSWILEGMATYKETDLERGIGRGQSTMFASMMREEVANGLQPISHVNLPVSTWPAGTTRYLYGVYFMIFLVDKYGEDKLPEWVEEYSNNLFPFFINSTAGESLGKNLTLLWEEYEQWLADRFQPQIDAIESQGIIAGEQISTQAYRTDSVRVREVSPLVDDADKTEVTSAVADTAVRKSGEAVYYVRNSGYKRANLVRIRDGESEDLVTLNGGADIDLHPLSGVLLTQDEFCNNYTIYRDIYRYDETEEELMRLTECGRYLYTSWHPDGKHIIAVHHDARQMALHLLDEQAQLQDVLWQAEDDEIVGQIDISPDGNSLVTSIWRKGEGWNIELFDLNLKQWQKVTCGANISVYPQFTEQGNILYSQEADGVYNLRRYNVETGAVEQLTNLIGGAFQSSQANENGPIYYTGYTAEGFAIFKLDAAIVNASTASTLAVDAPLTELEVLAEEDTLFEEAIAAETALSEEDVEPENIELDEAIAAEVALSEDPPTEKVVSEEDIAFNEAIAEEEALLIGTTIEAKTETINEEGASEESLNEDQPISVASGGSLEVIEYAVTEHVEEDYSALGNVYPQWWFPTFTFTDQRTELGITTSGADVLNVHQYSITASYDTKLNAPAGGLFYAYTDRFFASAQRANEITLNDDGSLQRVSNRSVASAVVAFPNYYLQQQYNLLFAAVYDNTEDGDLTAGAPPLDDFEDHILGIAGLYNSADFNPLSISANDGMTVRLVAEDSDALNSDFSGQVYTLDWRQYIRTGRESVLALRFVQGWGTDNPNPFRLGGDGLSDNVLNGFFGSSGQSVFDVREYTLRGYKEGHTELRGRRMQLLSGEWRFPIQRIEKGIMAPPIGIMQWFGKVFTDVGSAYQDSPETYYPSAGFELTADINVFYNLVLRTRLGYAHGFDKDIGEDQIYLKIGSSF